MAQRLDDKKTIGRDRSSSRQLGSQGPGGRTFRSLSSDVGELKEGAEDDVEMEVEAGVDQIVIELLRQEYETQDETLRLYAIFKSTRWNKCVQQLIEQMDPKVTRASVVVWDGLWVRRHGLV